MSKEDASWEKSNENPGKDILTSRSSKYDDVTFPSQILEKKAKSSNFSDKILKLTLRVGFIIITYFLGSTLSGYLIFLSNIQTESFLMIQFLTGLLILSVLSNLFGSAAGFIGGFIADLVYQLVSIKSIHWGFVVNTALLGLLSGIYRYHKEETVPKLKIMRFFYSLILASLLSLVLTDIGISIGVLLSELISFVFLGPLLIVLIDYTLTRNSDEQDVVYKMFLTHHYEYDADHSISVNVGGYFVFFCTRCSGTIMGIIIGIFIERILLFSNGIIISSQVSLYLCILFPLPGLIDWGTQKLLYRKSNDKIRIITGILLGIAMHMIGVAKELLSGIIIVTLIYFGIFTLLFILGSKKLRNKY